MSRGLKPRTRWPLNVRAKARTYLRNKDNSNDSQRKDNSDDRNRSPSGMTNKKG